MDTIGKRIKHLREKHKVTQVQLAAGSGVLRGNISHYEKGDWNPNFDTTAKIAKFFDVDPIWLFYGDAGNSVIDITVSYAGENHNEPSKSVLEEAKDLSNMTYSDGEKPASRDRKHLEQFLEEAIDEVMFSMKDENLKFTESDLVMLADAFKGTFIAMRDAKRAKREENKKKKASKSKPDKQE